jgi:hypothetical protein
MMELDSVISKIKKCLALAASSNPHEAAIAMRQAQKLMQQHGLSGIDVELAEIKEHSAKPHSQALPSWETTLGHMVSAAFACTWYFKHQYKNGRFVKQYVFVGIDMHAQTASYAFDVLSRQCGKDRTAYIKKLSKRLKSTTKTAKGDAFALGWVDSVSDLLDKFSGTEKQEALLLAYMKKHHPDMREAKTASRELNRHVRDDNFHHGRAAGRNAQLNRGVGGPEATKLITG